MPEFQDPLNLSRPKKPVLPDSQTLVCNKADSYTAKFHNPMPNCLKHLPDLSVSSLGQRYFEPTVCTFANRHNLAGGQLDAVCQANTRSQAFKLVHIGFRSNLCLIDFRQMIPRNRDDFCELTVVGHEDEPFSIIIESADGVDFALYVNQIRYLDSPLWISDRGNDLSGLIQQNVHLARRGWNPFPVNFYMIASRVGLGAQLSHDLTIDRYSPLLNYNLGLASRRQSGRRYYLL